MMATAVIFVPSEQAALCAFLLGGRPLLAWSIAAAHSARRVDRVVVVTTDPSIAALARQWDSDVCTVADDAWARMQAQDGNGLMVDLSPNMPFRRGDDIDAAIDLLERNGLDAIDAVGGAIEVLRNGVAERVLPHAGLAVRAPGSRPRSGKTGTIEVSGPRDFTVRTGDDLAVAAVLAQSALVATRSPRLPAADDLDLLCYDFDGVMTDNRVTVDQDGVESVTAHRGDGLAISAIRLRGIPQVILSLETNGVVRARARKLQIDVVQGLADKKEQLLAIIEKRGFDLRRVLYVGNDTNDAAAMAVVGYPIAPNDAHPTIRALACHVTRANGGYGVIRELYDDIFASGPRA